MVDTKDQGWMVLNKMGMRTLMAALALAIRWVCNVLAANESQHHVN
jgi:hypothetical protein